MKNYLGAMSLLALFSLSSSVNAASQTNWTGFHGGVALGWGASKAKDIFTGKNMKLRGWTYGLEFGGGASVMPSLYLGANFSIDFSTRSKKEKLEFQDNGHQFDISRKTKERAQYALTAQIGVPVCNFMPFAEVGYSWGSAKCKWKAELAGQDMTQQVSQELGLSPIAKGAIKGLIFGGGVKWQPAKNVLLGLSYRHAPNKIKFQGVKKSHYKNDSVRVSASYLFNF